MAVPLLAQDRAAGWSFYGRMMGSANSAGTALRFDPVIGYSFNRHIGIDAGVPIYVVLPSDSIRQATGSTSVAGIGNAYGALRFHLGSAETADFLSVVTVAAPTGDEDEGLGTGKVTADWSNSFSKSFGRLRPFGTVGIANSISDTAFFVRPFFTDGVVGHFEGGADYMIGRRWGVGASAYSIVPAGEQTVVSRVVPRGAPSGRGQGLAKRPFETEPVQVGPASLASDHGYSVWWQVWPSSMVALQAGYSRSMGYEFNSFFFGASFNIGSMVKRIRN